MTSSILQQLSQSIQISTQQVDAALQLLEQGATIPFIARYRKEATGSLDEIQVSAIRDQHGKIVEFEKRKTAIIGSLEERALFSQVLEKQIKSATSITQLEDIYLPYRIKRKSRASVAKDNGLTPLAEAILSQNSHIDTQKFKSIENDINTIEDALGGARDIIAEKISEDSVARSTLRNLFTNNSTITSTVKAKAKSDGTKYKDYFDFSQPTTKLPGHRLLAILRGEREKVLQVSLRPEQDRCLSALSHRFITKESRQVEQMKLAITDSYKRLLLPSLEKELTQNLLEKAEKEAIAVFAENLTQLLLSPPLGQKITLAVDPGFRTGCKVAVIDSNGNFLDKDTIFPTMGENQQQKAADIITKLVAKHRVQAIAIGNGTAGRETLQFIKSAISDNAILITLVNEDGASIYSASQCARDEFPDLDLTVRGAISIGRRLQDTLAELVKIDPKSIGVGQYQHDVNQTALKDKLSDVVSSCVNSVGVELNSASIELLTHVSGLGPVLAKNIVSYREANGSFIKRKDLLKVPRLGQKAFEQCAGFLRIQGSKNPLDNSAVHPERYTIVDNMAKDLKVEVQDLIGNTSLTNSIKITHYISSDIGEPTLLDIIAELNKPGRDPREEFQQFSYSEAVQSIEDVNPDMQLPGIITNITKFGAFVDIGVHCDGLIHISEMADKFIKDPTEVVRLNQRVMVRVLEVDKQRKRIGLSLKSK